MAAIIPAITAISGILGIASGVKSLFGGGKKDKAPEIPKLPAAPTLDQAGDKAADAAKRKRKISLLSGGKTDITRGQALVSEESVGKKSLLGQ